MLVAILSIIEWLKLIAGLTTASFGFIILIAMFYGWAKLYLTSGKLSSLGWSVAFAQFILSIILMIAGFYITGW